MMCNANVDNSIVVRIITGGYGCQDVSLTLMMHSLDTCG